MSVESGLRPMVTFHDWLCMVCMFVLAFSQKYVSQHFECPLLSNAEVLLSGQESRT